MKKNSTEKKLSGKEILSIIGIACLFIAASFFAQKYGDFFQNTAIFQGFTGIFIYIIITIIAVVVAPISTFPLLPLAVSIWGSFFAALFSIIGWSIGAIVAFGLARRFGKSFIAKIVSLKKIRKIERLIPEHNIFISIIFLRMALPVDVLSYALGLFSSVSFKPYTIATVIGVTPFAFIFSYTALFPFWLQGLFFLLAIVVLAIGYRQWRM